MSKSVVRLCIVAFVAAISLLSVGQKRGGTPHTRDVKPNSTRSAEPDESGKVASEDPDLTRFRVVTAEGILAVFDAAEEWDGRDEPASQLAYWNDFATQQFFFFDQLLFTDDDVLQSIAAMVRDLAIDPALLFAEKPELSPLPEITLLGQWIPAHETLVLAVMNGGQAAQAEGETAGLIQPCAPGGLCDPQAMATSGPIPGPVRGTPSDQLYAMASLGGKCTCTGGGGGVCLASQGFYCTVDACNPCEDPPNVCPPPDACTTGVCLCATGQCNTESYCGGHCCSHGKSAWCCGDAEECCPYYWVNEEEHSCCPPHKPLCLEESYCCPTNKPFLCGTTCCESEENCCDGVCRGACQVNCCNGEWYGGPCCGDGGCEYDQICCNGVCCGDSCNPGQCIDNQCITAVNACEDGNVCTDNLCMLLGCGEIECSPPIPNNAPCPDDGNICTNDLCQDGECTHPCKALCSAECTVGETAGWCQNCICAPSQCSLSLTSATVAPCETVHLTLTGDCVPDCGSTGFSVEVEYPPPYNAILPPWLLVSTPSSISCVGPAQSRNIVVTILEHAPPSEVPITVTGTTSSGSQCQATGTVTIDRTYPPIEIQYKTFISPAALQLGPFDYYYKGDNRAFGYGTTLSSRSIQSRTFSLNPAYNNGQPGDPTQFFGETVGYDDDPTGEDIATGAMWPCSPYNLYPIVPPVPEDDCILTANPGVEPNVLTMAPSRTSLTEIKVDVTLAGRNPCQHNSAPAINADLHVHLRQICENNVLKPMEFRLYGTHNGFPWHELYINQVLVFTHNPCCTGQSPLSLMVSHSFENIDAENPAGGFCDSPFPLGIPLGEWQPVPGVNP